MLHQAATYAALAAVPLAGTVLASTSPDSGLAPYLGGGAGVIAVGGLVEVTRRLLSGRLIPRETRDAEAETAAYIVAAGQREATAMRLVEDTNRHVAAMTRAVEDLRDEIRRDRRDR